MSRKQVTFSLPQAVIPWDDLQDLHGQKLAFNYFTRKHIKRSNWDKKPHMELNEHTNLVLDTSRVVKLIEEQPETAQLFALYKYLFKYYTLPKKRVIPLADEGLFDFHWDSNYQQYFPSHRLAAEWDGIDIEKRLKIVWYEPGERYVPVLHRAFQWHLQVV